MIIFLLSAAQGPSECCLAVALALNKFEAEARQENVRLSIVESEVGREVDTFRSILLKLDGDKSLFLARKWKGTIQWICQSPYRSKHRRKNWFITGSYSKVETNDSSATGLDSEIRFEAVRASGPGGQHVNKTNSAVRATHIPTGISVKVQTERSQHANKRLAKALIVHKLKEQVEVSRANEKSKRRLQHHSIERGNAVRIFTGIAFKG
ncbi:MAG: peptide chain release factor H [Kangiellaceae bacterium]|nr:peptide chain release factor H [Kangiellaceae bacterium]MCW9000671.1 peptide chain release factor H [Kangiellaceae bacterium]MCW9015353.1 peptide chain release factor H [Kangiellaceae bacterium]